VDGSGWQHRAPAVAQELENVGFLNSSDRKTAVIIFCEKRSEQLQLHTIKNDINNFTWPTNPNRKSAKNA